MSSNVATMDAGSAHSEKHPKGLYALFATEMWERFSFYSMLALFTLYLQDPVDGFGWTPAQATGLYANYLMFVYASPLIGGLIADKVTGYRKAVMIGGFFFMAGHGLLSIPAMWAVYAALTCLVIGNGFFKPNVSTMVGNLYPEGSHLKDRAYNIFYMGINIGAFSAPVVMELVKQKWGFHPAFAVAAFGMVISVAILWYYKSLVEGADKKVGSNGDQAADAAATAVDAPPHGVSDQAENLIDSVPDWKRIAALIVVFTIVIVFWMVFHQNGSTLTYWADDNTDWNVSGTISNAINPFWVVTLTFPLVWFWGFLDRRGKEPSTPTKMAIGMTLTGLSFFVLYYAATLGENRTPTAQELAGGSFRINERAIDRLKNEGVPQSVLDQIKNAKEGDKNLVYDKKFPFEKEVKPALAADGADKSAPATVDAKPVKQKVTLEDAVNQAVPDGSAKPHMDKIKAASFLFVLSPFWLIFAYAIVTLGELMLSPMGLSLVSKVAPIRMRGLMMGGWFVATAIGNKLTMIGIYWSIWYQSSFFLVLGGMALFMAVVLFLLLRPLKKAMPGV